ncbi:hypothetical protein ACI7RC_26100 [Brevibacillus sp. B_LB10_24]|uniref:hypothetical protein n=1 Tax=Brevibacillus TaxID=55080 RepID=UPI000374105E|nr:hypothetical protein [Brevibacillus massiliensis]
MRKDVKSLALDTMQTVLTDGQRVLKFFEDGGIDEGAYLPPKAFTIVGLDRIEALRDFLNEHFPVKGW